MKQVYCGSMRTDDINQVYVMEDLELTQYVIIGYQNFKETMRENCYSLAYALNTANTWLCELWEKSR